MKSCGGGGSVKFFGYVTDACPLMGGLKCFGYVTDACPLMGGWNVLVM